MANCTRAAILAAGRGSRMRRDAATAGLSAEQSAAAARGLKGMIPDDRGRPFLDHVLSSLADAGITDVCLVIGTEHDVIREHYALRPPHRLRLAFAVQTDPTGTADAVLTAESWTGGNDFLVLNADNLYPVAAIGALVTLSGPGLVAFDRDALVRESNIEPARIGAFAILTLREDDTLAAIVEKPGDRYEVGARGAPMISMNIWRFGPDFFGACRDVPLSQRGEHELPLAVGLAISRGTRFRAVRIAAGVLDLSNSGDIAAVAQRLGAMEINP
ncbi:MAG: sugar phosphate nucleotidyltransferase [Gemmatimonadota bacterium]